MAYVSPDFKTKKALKAALKEDKPVYVYQPNADLTGAQIPTDGPVTLEGPHYPKPHSWYAQGTMKDGKLIKVV